MNAISQSKADSFHTSGQELTTNHCRGERLFAPTTNHMRIHLGTNHFTNYPQQIIIGIGFTHKSFDITIEFPNYFLAGN